MKLAFGVLFAMTVASAAPYSLNNGKLSTEFDERGLIAPIRDNFCVTLDGQTFDAASLPAPVRKADADRVTYSYRAGRYEIDAVYELRPDWRFLSKQLVIRTAQGRGFHLDEISVFCNSAVTEALQDTYIIDRKRDRFETRDYGAALRFAGGRGLLAVVQNPFLEVRQRGRALTVAYQPNMDWDMAWGAFETDRGLLYPLRLTGRRLPAKMIPEWSIAPADTSPGLDEAEIDAFTDMVRAFLLYRPTKPLNIMVGWCVNDYQIDIAKPEGRDEYKRIMDMASTLGADHLLFAPANSDVSRREESTDDWKWEFVLWLGLGEKIRKHEWDPSTGTIPASIREMLDYAKSKNLGLLAYVYPVLGLGGNPYWLVGTKRDRANLAFRGFQDWLIGALEGFYKHTDISGYSFDHTFLNLDGASRYAQWWGWRRVMETLRRDLPDIAIDGRQAYQNYGPWSWLAGSYPHPTSTDEQPESFVSFPDLKVDRVSADRERYTAYWYRDYEFAPSEIMPGFITHQTPRSDDSGHMPERDDALLSFRARDWDYLGWRYSLLSSIAVAGLNNVLDMIPARDLDEFKNFSAEDKQFFRRWIDWTRDNRDYLVHTRPILGQPAIGKVDGTSAILDGNRGFIFLFNPNGRQMPVNLRLDRAIGLTENELYAVRELYPVDGRRIWVANGTVTLTLDGGSAIVLRVEPAPATIDLPLLFNTGGAASIDGGVLTLTGVRGEIGTTGNLVAALPAGVKINAVVVNGRKAAFVQTADNVSVTVKFAGVPFHHYQQIDPQKPLGIPKRIFDQLAARRAAWPIPWTADDYRSTWLAPERLLLYIQLAEPDDHWAVSLKIDGRAVDLQKAYASVRPVHRNFTGFYADVSKLTPDRDHRLELQLPPGLKTGQFLGIFVENVETEYTDAIAK